ncbi:ubiquitin-specific protease ubp2 [Tulasnella sp. 417]|nr:ubiquitin-specific protease ubp2 [Tulasnella sp. 417]
MSSLQAGRAWHSEPPPRPSQRNADSAHAGDTNDPPEDLWWHQEYMEHVMQRPGPGCLPARAATEIHGTFHKLYRVTVTPPCFPPINPQPVGSLQLSPPFRWSGSSAGPSTSSVGLAEHRPPSESEVRYLIPHPYVQFCRRDMAWVYHQAKSSMYLPQLVPNSGTLPSEVVRRANPTCVEVDETGIRDMSFPSSKAKTHHFHHYPKSVKGSSINPPFVRRKIDLETAAAVKRRKTSSPSSSSRHRAKATSAPTSESTEILLDLWRYIRDREAEPTSRPSKEESVIYALETVLRIIENFLFKLDNRMIKVGPNLIRKIGWTAATQEFLAFLGFQHLPVLVTETESHPEGRLNPPKLAAGSPENDMSRAKLLQSWLELSIITQHYRKKHDRALQGYDAPHRMWVSIGNTFDETRRQIGAHETQIRQMPLAQSQLIHQQARVFWDGLGTTPETHSSEVVKFAYRRQTHCDPKNTPYYFSLLKGLSVWATRIQNSSAEGLQILVIQEESRGRWSTDDLSRAAMMLGFMSEEDIATGNEIQLPPTFREDLRDAWLTRVKEVNTELSENRINRQMAEDRKRDLKECFRILAEHSRLPELVQGFRDNMRIYGNGMVDVQDAYNTLEVRKELDEDMIITIFNMRVEDKPNFRERMLSALLVIGEDRNSSRLKNLALTGTDYRAPGPKPSRRDRPRSHTQYLNPRPDTLIVSPAVSSTTADELSITHSEPNEITALLPPDSASQQGRLQPPLYMATGHSSPSPALVVSHRSTYPSTPLTPPPIPLRPPQHSTWPFRIAFVTLIFLAFLSTALLVATVLNICLPRLIAGYLPTHRGSRVLPFWFTGIATWLSLSTLILFWTPSRATRISLRISLAIAFFDLIVLSTVPEFIHRESALTVLTCALAIGVIAICLLSNKLVQNVEEEQGKTIKNRARNPHRTEWRAEILSLTEGQEPCTKQPLTFFTTTMSFLLAFSANIILVLLTVDLPVRTYDATRSLPFKNSQLKIIRPPESSHTFRVHLACAGPNTVHQLNNSAYADALKPGSLHQVPTILYEAPSKVSGTEGAEWLLNMRDRGEVGRVCLWDRPGYGFSDTSPDAEIGAIEDALWQALENNGEKGPYLLVAEGYGGYV